MTGITRGRAILCLFLFIHLVFNVRCFLRYTDDGYYYYYDDGDDDDDGV